MENAPEIRHIQTTKAFRALENDWNNLLTQSNLRTAFLSWEWLFSWWQVYGGDKTLWIITAWQDNALTGIFPLAMSIDVKSGFKFHTLRSLGSPLIDVGGIIVKENDTNTIDSLIKYLIAHKDAWDILELNQFMQNNPTLDFLRKEFVAAGAIARAKTDKHFYVPLNTSWDNLLASLSKGFRKNLRRAQKRAEDSGEVQLEHFSQESVRWDVFERILEVNRHAQYPLLYNSEDERALHKAFVEHHHGKNFLTIFLLSINGIPKAYEYGFLYDGRYESWRAGYDKRLDPKISIGVLLLQKVIKYAIEIGYDEIDFLRGEEAYKQRWQPLYREYAKIRFIKKNNIPAYTIFVLFPKLKEWLKTLLPIRNI